MRAILIPVKVFGEAKQRLAGFLHAEDRARLAQAMMQDLFCALGEIRGIERVFVVSSERVALDEARERGWEALGETRQSSESDSVDWASRWCAARGASSILRIPIDLPLLQCRDVEAILEKATAARGAVIVPSRDGKGTNALLRTPPELFPSRFGPGSFARHVAAAAQAGVAAAVLRNPRLEFDVDELVDLRDLWDLLSQGAARVGDATTKWMRTCWPRYQQFVVAAPARCDRRNAEKPARGAFTAWE